MGDLASYLQDQDMQVTQAMFRDYVSLVLSKLTPYDGAMKDEIIGATMMVAPDLANKRRKELDEERDRIVKEVQGKNDV